MTQPVTTTATTMFTALQPLQMIGEVLALSLVYKYRYDPKRFEFPPSFRWKKRKSL